MIQELVRVLAPLEPGVVQAVVQFLASSAAPGAALYLQRLPSLLLVSESFPRCPAVVALHCHCSSPACSQEERGVEVGVVAHPLGQIDVPSRGRLLLPDEGVVDIRVLHAEYGLELVRDVGELALVLPVEKWEAFGYHRHFIVFFYLSVHFLLPLLPRQCDAFFFLFASSGD